MDDGLTMASGFSFPFVKSMSEHSKVFGETQFVLSCPRMQFFLIFRLQFSGFGTVNLTTERWDREEKSYKYGRVKLKTDKVNDTKSVFETPTGTA